MGPGMFDGMFRALGCLILALTALALAAGLLIGKFVL